MLIVFPYLFAYMLPVLDHRERCCGSGIRCFFDPWIRDGKNPGLGSGIRNKYPNSYFREFSFNFWGLKYLNSLWRIRILDRCLLARNPGWN
jgi:hypothetical protein